MMIATWNVNSLRVRLEQALEWLEASGVDILGIQETKLQDSDFPVDEFDAAGFHCVYSGQKTYNGVAVVARYDTVIEQLGEPESVITDLPELDDSQRRVLAVDYGDIRVVNLYVPNGQSVGSEKYEYKLAWLAALRKFLSGEQERGDNLVVMGDFNIAPDDRDVYDPVAWRDKVLCSQPERDALGDIMSIGLTDAYRKLEEAGEQFSWWDYRAGAFRRNRGLRIDLILTNEAATNSLISCAIDKEPRTWERPSDHTPVVAEFTF